MDHAWKDSVNVEGEKINSQLIDLFGKKYEIHSFKIIDNSYASNWDMDANWMAQ